MAGLENQCKARECENCCWNTFLGMDRGNFHLFHAALKQRGVQPQKQIYESFQMVQAFTTNTPGKPVVVYCEDHPHAADILVQMVRACPFLKDGDCELIGDHARPLGCERLVFDGDACRKIRSGSFTFIPLLSIE